MALLLSRWGTLAHRHRLAVILAWLAVLVLGGVGALTLGGSTTETSSIPGQESTDALDRISATFGAIDGGASAQVVVQAPDGATLTDPTQAAALEELITVLGALPGVSSAGDPLDPGAPAVNEALTTGYSTVTYGVPPGGVTPAEQEALLDAVAAAGGPALTIEVAGAALDTSPEIGGIGEIAGVAIAVLVLALTYGSLVVAGMNLLTASVGVGVGILGITIAAGFTELSSISTILAAMLGLAVGIDYALFIINRYRQELLSGADVPQAISTAVGTAGSAVVTAGLTVVIALLGLFVAGIPFVTQMGIAAAATIVVAVLVALTLVPAVLALLGRRALPKKSRNAPPVPADHPQTASSGGVFGRWVDAVTRHRVLAVIAAVVALGVITVPVASMRTTLVSAAPADSTQERAQQLLTDGFGAGINGPILVLLEGADAASTAASITPMVQGLEDVVAVTPPLPSADGTAALLTVIPGSGPASEATEQLVTDLRSELADLDGVDGVTASVTGQTAVSVDVAASLNTALPIYLALVVGLALVLLVLVFRSLLVPLIGVLGFLLTIGGSLGATVAVFQWGWLGGVVNLESAGPLISLTPILVTGILFGLAMDYQVFLVSRMHEAHTRGAAPLTAIRNGFRSAAPVVFAAALIMFSVFAGFVPTGDSTIKSIGFALAVGVIIDALVVRMVLVPAALALLGERAWWLPRWLHWLPKVDVEGTALDRSTPVRETASR